MRTFRTHLQALISATWASDRIALRPREQIDNQANETRDHHQKHPEDGAIHAAGLGVARHPDEENDVQYDQPYEQQANKSKAAKTSGRARSVIVSQQQSNRGHCKC